MFDLLNPKATMRIHKLSWKLFPLIFIALALCSCAKVEPQKPAFHRITVQQYMQANIQAQQDQDARIKRKSDELDRMHIAGSEKAKQLEIEKVAAHKAFLQQLDDNKKAIVASMSHRGQSH